MEDESAFQFFDQGFGPGGAGRGAVSAGGRGGGASGSGSGGGIPGGMNGFAFQEFGSTQSQSQRVDMFTQGDLTQARSELTQFTQPDGGDFCSQNDVGGGGVDGAGDEDGRRRHSSTSSSSVRKSIQKEI